MSIAEIRASYVQELAKSVSTEDGSEDKMQDILTQSLLELEQRFRGDKLRGVKRKLSGTSTDTKQSLKMKCHIERQESQEVRHIHRDALRICFRILTSDLDLSNTSLMDELYQLDVLSLSDTSSIKGRDTRKRQNEEFLTHLDSCLTFEDFNIKFLPALSKDHQHLADMLVAEVDMLEEGQREARCLPCRVRKHVQIKRLAAPLLEMGAIDLQMYGDLRSSKLYYKDKWESLVKDVPHPEIISALKKKCPDFYREFQEKNIISLECRCMSQDSACEPSGLPISVDDTLSVEYVDDEENDLEEDLLSFQEEDLDIEYKMSSPTRGICLVIYIMSEHYANSLKRDIQNVKSTFRRLCFSVVCKEITTPADVKRILNEYSSKDHSQHDAFMCVILSMTPGCESELTSMFNGDRCPSLIGKPKIFLLDYGRGEKITKVLKTPAGHCIADEADILIGFSTAEGNRSLCNSSLGSRFIRTLTKVLDSKADKHDLLECLTMTNREMSGLVTKLGQVSAPVFTLTKKIYLTSDPLWPHTSNQEDPPNQ